MTDHEVNTVPSKLGNVRVNDNDNINPFSQYTDYEKIEAHLDFSRTFFILDKKGQHILSELEERKALNKKKKSFSENIHRIYTNLVDVLNVKKLTPRLYCTLMHFMDELIFKEVSDYDKFFIEDDGFDLTKVYFGQSLWIRDQEVQHFQMDEGTDLNINEAMCLICYMREYENFILSIEEYIDDLDSPGLKKNIEETVDRIRRKLKVIWDIVIEIVTSTIRNEGDGSEGVPIQKI